MARFFYKAVVRSVMSCLSRNQDGSNSVDLTHPCQTFCRTRRTKMSFCSSAIAYRSVVCTPVGRHSSSTDINQKLSHRAGNDTLNFIFIVSIQLHLLTCFLLLLISFG